MPTVHEARDPYALPPEAERTYVGVTSRTNELGQVDVLELFWPYPPCRAFRVTSSVEVTTADPRGIGAGARTWRVRIGGGRGERVVFHQRGRWFVRRRDA